MTTARTPGVFGFEEVTGKLEWMPLAARRALDLSGLHISLATWQAFELERRRGLVELGAADEVDVVRVSELVGEDHEAREPVALGSGNGPSAELRGLLADDERLSSAWSRLSPLARYALEKMAVSQRRDPEEQRRRLREARDELCPVQDPTSGLTHLDARGEAHMVDVSEKPTSARYASASASLRMERATLRLLQEGRTAKGDVLATARIAGIQAAKRTWELIPLCHSIALSSVEIELSLDAELPGVRIVARARTVERTGVEMEALVAASVAGLTLYDMLKAVDRGMVLEAVRLEEKSGGRSGDYLRSDP